MVSGVIFLLLDIKQYSDFCRWPLVSFFALGYQAVLKFLPMVSGVIFWLLGINNIRIFANGV